MTSRLQRTTSPRRAAALGSLQVACLAVCLAACGNGGVDGGSPADDGGPVAIPSNGIDGMQPAHAEAYLRKIAPMLVSRVLSPEERATLGREGGKAIRPILEAWGEENAFVRNARGFVEMQLAVGGSASEIDFGLPGRTVSKTVGDGLPWSHILTATSCFTPEGAETPCDTGAPYTAGVLTTRAFMASHRGRFNLGRARTMLGVFACQKYPLANDLEPALEKARLIEMFRAETPDEQTVDAARAGFGNGLACYSCHGQFGLHAQLFVKFNEAGQWIGDATGLQSQAPEAEIGRSDNGLMTSHLVRPEEASQEASRWFGEPVANLAEAAHVLGGSWEFQECTVRNLVAYVLGLTSAADIDAELLSLVVVELRQRSLEPTFQQIVTETFAHPKVAFTTLNELRRDRVAVEPEAPAATEESE